VFKWLIRLGGVQGAQRSAPCRLPVRSPTLRARSRRSAIEKQNREKAALIYDAIESSGGFFRCHVQKDVRSKMNVVCRILDNNEKLEKDFCTAAEKAGFIGVKGHRYLHATDVRTAAACLTCGCVRSMTGGIRVSLYNAVTREQTAALAAFMREFGASRK
jgi:phosphoserine aminotransferase